MVHRTLCSRVIENTEVHQPLMTGRYVWGRDAVIRRAGMKLRKRRRVLYSGSWFGSRIFMCNLVHNRAVCQGLRCAERERHCREMHNAGIRPKTNAGVALTG